MPVLTNAPCVCTDEHGSDQTEVLRQLIASGMGQWEASMRLWGPDASLLDQRTRIRAWVRTEFQKAFPWLKLPATTEASTEGGTA